MRTELWGLRDRETHEPIYTYFASSNPHRAIFAKKKSAEMACQHPMSKRYEPFKITGYESIDPVRAAGGCYCRECCFGRKPRAVDMQDGYVYCQEQSKYKEIDSFCSDGEIKEAQDA